MSASLFIQQDKSLTHHFSEQDFDENYWRLQPDTQVLEGGRGASFRIRIDEQDWVLRRYLRGGMMAKLFRDQYLWTSLQHTRPWREWMAVERGRQHQLPIPSIAAVQVRRHGLFYRAAIITSYIDNQGTLADYLRQKNLTEESWVMLGQQIYRLHQAGLNHADLNANNILVDGQLGFHLIDFDKAKIHQRRGGWCAQNLQRLSRSLHKIQGQQQELGDPFYFSPDDWNSLLQGYR